MWPFLALFDPFCKVPVSSFDSLLAFLLCSLDTLLFLVLPNDLILFLILEKDKY